MTKYLCAFTTEIRGQVTIEAANIDEARKQAQKLADDTINYDELTNEGRCAPDVETEFDDIMEVK